MYGSLTAGIAPATECVVQAVCKDQAATPTQRDCNLRPMRSQSISEAGTCHNQQDTESHQNQNAALFVFTVAHGQNDSSDEGDSNGQHAMGVLLRWNEVGVHGQE